MQTPSGGFGVWPGDPNPVLWGTAFVLHLMLDAKERGYGVPQSSLDSAIDWLDRNADNTAGGPKFLGTHPGYVQYVLAKAGRPHLAVAKRLLANMPDQPTGADLEGRMLLRAALQLSGDRRYEKQLRDVDVSPLDPQRHNGWSYYSDLRRRGMALTVFHELFGSHADGQHLADFVADRLRGDGRYNTQEVVWSVSGLGRWLSSHDPVPGAGLKLDGAWVAAAADRKGKTDLAWQLAGASQAESLVLDLGSKPKHAVSLVVTVEGIPTEPESGDTGDRGLRLTRTYHTGDGRPVSAGEVQLGDLLYVQLELTSLRGEGTNHVAIVDRIPAGWEIENPRLGRGSLPDWAPRDQWALDYLDVKDDRYMAFGSVPRRGQVRVLYAVRATSEGEFALPSHHSGDEKARHVRRGYEQKQPGGGE